MGRNILNSLEMLSWWGTRQSRKITQLEKWHKVLKKPSLVFDSILFRNRVYFPKLLALVNIFFYPKSNILPPYNFHKKNEYFHHI